MKKLLDLLTRCLFPQSCIGCGAERTPLCAACAKTLASDALTTKIDEVDSCFIASNYQTPLIADLIKAFKYYNIQAYRETLGKLLVERLLKENNYASATIIPIPLHRLRYRERGYNQAQLLAEIVAHHFAYPLSTDLVRTRRTKPQARLNKKDRQTNVINIFRYALPVAPKHVLLIDDVTTTGATLTSAAQTLRAHGAEIVDALVIAKNI